jgi:hypothetical protein
MLRPTQRLALASSIVACFVAGVNLQGCGSDEETQAPEQTAGSTQDGGGQGGGGGSAGIDGSKGGTGGSVLPDGAAGDVSQGGDGSPHDQWVDVKANCSLIGVGCITHSDCCSANCDPTSKICTNPVGPCKAAGLGCAASTECCTTVCRAGICGSAVCTSDNQPCAAADECCGGKCEGGSEGGMVCTPLNPDCWTVGNGCAANAECCSKLCSNGRCSGQPSFCTQTGDACTSKEQCCGGKCNVASGATLGVCEEPDVSGVGNCDLAGQVCGAGAIDGGISMFDGGLPSCGGSCCSRACAPYGPTGVMICQPPSGCRPVGEICRNDSDCCGSEGMPGGNGSITCSKSGSDPVGRCDNGQACNPAGAICKLWGESCSAADNCCAGNVNQHHDVCLQDSLGIPRCRTATTACSDAESYQGKACASSADCCGLACIPNANPGDGGSPLICGSTCVPKGGACTNDSDCCPGLPCVALPGTWQGICGYVPANDAGTPDGANPDAEVPDGPAADGAVLPDAEVPDGPPPCSLYGQTCTVSADCCNGVPCTSGRCMITLQ